MKLHKLYSSDTRFHRITFKDGLNIVIGKVSHPREMEKDSHNLGKSTLIDVLDFMLLKAIDKNHIFKKYSQIFDGHIFYLELLLNSREYLTIRRSVAEPTKIAFKKSDVSIDCNEGTIWDLYNISLDHAKLDLNEQLNFDVLTDWDYRKFVSFFLRTQKDYGNVFQLGKFMNGKHKQWKPAVFQLLGYDSKPLIEKYEFDDKLEKLDQAVKTVDRTMSVSVDDYDKVKSALDLRSAERDDMKVKIDAFNFYTEERSINSNLVEEIERKIAQFNREEYFITYNLDKAKDSVKNIPTFDVGKVKELYDEVGVLLPDNLVNDYEALLDFNKKVTKERNKYLREQISELENKLKFVLQQLAELNSRRNSELSVLQDKDTFRKFKTYEKKLAALEGEISSLEIQLKNIDQISLLNEQMEKINQQIKDTSKILKATIAKSSDISSKIKSCFNNIFSSIFGVRALLYVRTNSNGNVEFNAEVAQDENSEATAEGQGSSYKKMLCVAFDLAVLATYSDKSFFRFVYHDGVFEGLDNRKKKLFIETVVRYCQQYHIQYIFSSIEDDIPADILASFTAEQKCLVLNDEDDKGKLFGFSF